MYRCPTAVPQSQDMKLIQQYSTCSFLSLLVKCIRTACHSSDTISLN